MREPITREAEEHRARDIAKRGDQQIVRHLVALLPGDVVEPRPEPQSLQRDVRTLADHRRQGNAPEGQRREDAAEAGDLRAQRRALSGQRLFRHDKKYDHSRGERHRAQDVEHAAPAERFDHRFRGRGRRE